MTFVPEEKIQEIRDRANIVSIISQYVPLKKIGANYKACCPFHAEKTPSFVVSDAKRIFHCFGCGKGGNVFTFLMDYTGLSFPDAVQKLADQVGVEIRLTQAPVTSEKRQTLQRIYYGINKQTLLFFKGHLKHSKAAQSFLKSRGLYPSLADRFHLGAVPDEWHLLEHFLLKKGISRKYLIELGLLVQKEGGNTYDRFRNRIIFPLFDLNSRVLGFGGRTVDVGGTPKYLNSAESPIYHKSKELYGLSHAVKAGIHRSGLIVVEGYFDCLLLVQAGFKNVVATMGTALTPQHVVVLKRFTDKIFLLFDGDEPGQMAAERSIPLFFKEGVFPKIVMLPTQMDPDDFIRQRSKEEFLHLLKASLPAAQFIVSRLKTREFVSKGKMIEEVLPHLNVLPDGIERDEVIRCFSDGLGLEEKWVRKPLTRGPVSTDQKAPKWQSELQKEISSAEFEVLEFFALFPHWVEKEGGEKTLDLFTDLGVKMIGLEIHRQWKETQTVDFPSVLDKIESPDLRALLRKGVLEKEGQNLSEADWKKVFVDCQKRVQRNYLEEIEKKLLGDIRACEGDVAREDQKVRLLNEYQKIVRQKSQL